MGIGGQVAKNSSTGAGAPFQRLSTMSQREDHRFDFWRSLHPLIDLEIPDRQKAKNYRAELLHCVGEDGTGFGLTRSDDTIAHFAKPDGAFVLFTIPLSGQVNLDYGQDGRQTLTALSGVTVVDGARPMTTETRGLSHLYLMLDRDRVVRALGARDELLADGVVSLPPGGLTAMLASHLMTMAREGEQFDAEAGEIAMKAAADLALGAIAQAGRADAPLDGERHGSALYAAACRYIELNLGNPDLTAETIARSLGCSRTHLYRAFENRNGGIGERIRVARLTYATGLLSLDPARPIKQIAHASGYGSAAAFARAFRDHTGLSPTEYRLRPLG